MATILNTIRSAGVPLRDAFLPALNANPHPSLVNGHIQLTYTAAPAPLGVAEFGLRNVSGTISPFTLNTSSLMGQFSPYALSGISQGVSSIDEYGVQLNAVLNDVTLLGTPGYDFWTQNVVEYSPYSSQLFLESSVWNFSAPGLVLSPNAIYAHGPQGHQVGTAYYYALAGPLITGYPFTLNLFLNSTLVDGRDATYFNYTLVNSSSEFSRGSIDYVIFNSTVSGGPAAPPPEYVAEGTTYNPVGLPNDFEMVLGGPGGGSNFDVFSASAYVGLSYWNATLGKYVTVPSAYDVGGETGETAVGANPIWGHPTSTLGLSDPDAFLATGPSLVTGMWNVSGHPLSIGIYGNTLNYDLAPANAFTFIAAGDVFTSYETTNWALFQWAPPASSYELMSGNYTVLSLLAEDSPVQNEVDLTTGSTAIAVTLTPESQYGAYTPLWAFDNSDIANISMPTFGGPTLFNDQFGPLGTIVSSTGLITFPWFGMFNDYFYPVFPGILLWGTTTAVRVDAPASFGANLTDLPVEARYVSYFGTPASNNLPFLFYDSTNVSLESGQISGWQFSGSYFGPPYSAYNVVFWNSSHDQIRGNTFATGGSGLFLYGGSYNWVENNTFATYAPYAPDPFSVEANLFGATGLFEADYGNASLQGPVRAEQCFSVGYCDVVVNNIFYTFTTAISPSTDPYTDGSPRCPGFLGGGPCVFSEAWNFPPTRGTNIIGGPMLGGNYWWDYGSPGNPFAKLPYDASYVSSDGVIGIAVTGDYYPLVPFSLYTVTFTQTGLPSGVEWGVGVPGTGGSTVWNYSTSNPITQALPNGTYPWSAVSSDPSYAASNPSPEVTINGAAVSVSVTFTQVYRLTFSESGLPAGTAWQASVTQDGVVNGTSSTTSSIVIVGFSGAYSYNVSASGYVATPASGSGILSANTTVPVAFALPDGTLAGTVSVTTATLTVDGSAVTLSGGGTFSLLEAPGVHAIVASASGYYTYYNNVSVASNTATIVTIAMTAVPSSGRTSGLGGISTTGWLLIAVLGALAVIFLITTFVFAGRGRRPPQMTAYSPSPPSGAVGPPPPSWSEGETPPPGAT